MKRSAGIVIIYQNKILLVHPSGSKRYWGNYSFPKGGVDKGETILQAALRELEEEVGIKLKKKQLDKTMYEIQYVSKGKKSWSKVPKGQIYKTVYYWTCHIDDLSEIGLTDEVVPKKQLQIDEVNWAGFVPAHEIGRRIAPAMSSIEKHINKGVNEDLIPGGLGDKHTPETLAKLHDVSKEKIVQQIQKGMKVEMEHVDDTELAREIAIDHLVEMPDYYDKLQTIEPAHENKMFKLKSLIEFVNEKYFTYDDFNSKWGSPEEMKEDVEITLRNMLPRDSFEIKSINDMSSDKGIKFEIKLSTGDTVHAYKNSQWRGQYEWYLNKKKLSAADIQNHFFEKLKPLDQYLRQLKAHDFFHQYADDHRAWKSGERHIDVMTKLYDKLSSGDKKKAYNEYLKATKKIRDHKPKDFKSFKGI